MHWLARNSRRARRPLVHGNYLRFTDDKSCKVVIIGIVLNIAVMIASEMMYDTPIYTAFALILSANSIYLGTKCLVITGCRWHSACCKSTLWIVSVTRQLSYELGCYFVPVQKSNQGHLVPNCGNRMLCSKNQTIYPIPCKIFYSFCSSTSNQIYLHNIISKGFVVNVCASMNKGTRGSLVQVVICHLCGTKTLLELLVSNCQLNCEEKHQ